MFENKYPYTDFSQLNLDWFLLKFKELLEEQERVSGKVKDLDDTVKEFTDFVTNYFDNLDVQAEVNVKLNEMAADGTLSDLLAPLVSADIGDVVAAQIGDTVAGQIDDTVADQIDAVVADQIGAAVAPEVPGAVTSWLNDNVDPVGSAVVVDSSLSVSGAAADAKVTGDNVKDIKSFVGESLLFDGSIDTWVENKYIRVSDGAEISGVSWQSSPYIEIPSESDIIIKTANSSSVVGMAFYDKNNTFISGEALVWDSTTTKEFTVTSPSNAKYLRYSAQNLPIVLANSYAKMSTTAFEVILNHDNRIIDLENDVAAIQNQPNIKWQLAMDKVLCIGDSLTSGAYYDGSTFNGASIAQNYPYFLSRILNTTVTNAGVSGINVTEWLTNEYSKYTYTDYNTIIIWLGSNGGLLETLPENPTEGQTLAHNNYISYRQLIANLQTANPNALIVVCLIYFTNYWVDISNEALQDIATEYNLPVVDLSDLNAENYPDLRYIDVNRYHLIKCGNIVVASRISDAMKRWFAESPQRCEFGLSLRT